MASRDVSRKIALADAASSEEEEPAHQPLINAAGLPALQVDIPQTVYSGVIFVPLLVDIEGCMEWMKWCGNQYFLYFLNMFTQMYFIKRIHSIYQEQIDSIIEDPDDCDQLSFELLILCMLIFCAYVIADLQESMYMVELVNGMSSEDGDDEMFVYAKNSDGELEQAQGGLGCCRKVMAMIFVILPKVVLAVVLMIYGLHFLASSSSDADVLLNSMALCFVLDLDEMLFAVFTPCFNKRLLEAMPAYTQDKDISRFWRFWYCAGPACKIALIAVLAYFVSTHIPRCGGTGNAAPGATSVGHGLLR